jgi:hypothetical protein
LTTFVQQSGPNPEVAESSAIDVVPEAEVAPVDSLDPVEPAFSDSTGEGNPTRRRPPIEEPEPTSPPAVRMTTALSEYAIGERVVIAIEISSASDVGHVPFHVTFDNFVLQFEYGREGDFLGNDGRQTAFFANATSSGDSIVVGLSRLGRIAGASGGGDLCVLYFTAVGPGNAALRFARAKVRDSSNRIVPSVFQEVGVVVR